MGFNAHDLEVLCKVESCVFKTEKCMHGHLGHVDTNNTPSQAEIPRDLGYKRHVLRILFRRSLTYFNVSRTYK